MEYRVLIVEDEGKLREVLCDWFRGKGDVPVPAADGAEALEKLAEAEYDAVLLDVLMPELDGFSVCRAARKGSDVPIIFLTALSDEEDKLLGYELGADDYVTKPFSMAVLYAKTEALIRRRRGSLRSGDLLEAGGIRLRLSTRQAWAGKRELALTPREFSLLECLLRNKGIVLSREQLLVKCWGYDYEGEARAVDTQVKRLLEKLGPLASEKRLTAQLLPGEACRVAADEGRVGQAMENLLTNALRYAPAGSRVALRVEKENGWAVFRVENPVEKPFTPEEREKVWEPFYRRDKARDGSGTGLGLSIVKQIVELHGGACSLRNTASGVEFRFTLPL